MFIFNRVSFIMQLIFYYSKYSSAIFFSNGRCLQTYLSTEVCNDLEERNSSYNVIKDLFERRAKFIHVRVPWILIYFCKTMFFFLEFNVFLRFFCFQLFLHFFCEKKYFFCKKSSKEKCLRLEKNLKYILLVNLWLLVIRLKMELIV